MKMYLFFLIIFYKSLFLNFVSATDNQFQHSFSIEKLENFNTLKLEQGDWVILSNQLEQDKLIHSLPEDLRNKLMLLILPSPSIANSYTSSKEVPLDSDLTLQLSYGEVLIDQIKKASNPPKRVIVIDSRPGYLESIRKVFEEHPIKEISLHLFLQQTPEINLIKEVSPAVQVAVPLTQMSNSLYNWSLIVAIAVNEYFSKSYEDQQDKTSPFFSLKCSDGTVVYRPNHSLAHGLRQAYLAVDIVLELKKLKKDNLQTVEGKALFDWIVRKINEDKNFLRKIEFANAFQRTGRQSEISRSKNKEKYEAYLLADQNNFQKKVSEHIGPNKLFKDQEEVNVYKQAIVEKFDKREATISDDVFFLSKIFYSAHLLDLRRLPDFSKDEILKNVSSQLFGIENPHNSESQIIMNLWQRSGEYLRATGDRDMDDPARTNWDASVFCSQAHDPRLLVQALQISRTKPELKLLESILNHTQVIRELKENEINSPKKKLPEVILSPAEQSEQERKIVELRNTLETSNYTASEGYLKILLENQYKEIPLDASEGIARDIIHQNIKTFLAENKKVKDPNQRQQIFIPRVESPDDQYINTLIECMMEERKNRGKIVLYHATEPEVGFLYDIYTEIRNQLIMKGGKEIRTLRAIDRAFIQLDEKVKEISGKEKADINDFLEAMKDTDDNNRQYQDIALSTNIGLFGSDQQKNSDTYSMFFHVKDKPVTLHPPVYDKFFDFIEQETGIRGEYQLYKPILDRFVMKCQGQPCRNGRLIQIFIDPEVLDTVTYFSVILGYKVIKQDKNPSLAEPLKLLRTKPDTLITYLADASGPPKREAPLKLHDLQARLFMRPELMSDSNAIQIKTYWRFGPPENVKIYYSEIKKLVNQNLLIWLKEGAPSQPDAFVPETIKLNEFTKKVYEGSTGSNPPKAIPISIEDQLVRLLQNEKSDQAARVLNENYNYLVNKIFIVPIDQAGHFGGQYNLTELIKNYQLNPVLKIAFEKGIFKGGMEAYEVAQSLKGWQKSDFLNILPELKYPSETLRLYIQYFNSTKPSETLNLLKAIDYINNDESIIKVSEPLFKLFEYSLSDRVLKGVAQIPEDKRQEIITETLSYISEREPTAYARDEKLHKINFILLKVFQMHEVDSKKRELIWSVLKQVELDWGRRLYLIEGIKTFNIDQLIQVDSQLKNSMNEQDKEILNKEYEKISFNEIFQPLFERFKGPLDVPLVQKITEYIPPLEWKDLVSETLSCFKNAAGQELVSIEKNLKDIMVKIWSMQKTINSINHRLLLWKLAGHLVKEQSNDWKWGLGVIKKLEAFDFEVLQIFDSKNLPLTSIRKWPKLKIEWVLDKQRNERWISVPFTANEVIVHANTKPEDYNMIYLQSDVGIILLDIVIEKLNSHMIPKDDFESFSMAYNRSNPHAGYNKSLIAHYVSRLAK